MNEYFITALIYPDYRDFALDSVQAHNLREAWRIFKHQNSNYFRLRFYSAFSRNRYFFKVN